MKVLLIGSAGLVGQGMLQKLLASPQNQIFYTTHNIHLGQIGNGIEVKLNVLSDELEEIVRRIQPHAIINASGLNGFQNCEKNPELAKNLNTDLVFRLSKLSNELDVKLVQFSTNAVFGSTKLDLRESTICSPTTTYGRTKKNAEDILLKENPNSLIIRTCDVYGNYVYEFRNKRFAHWVVENLSLGNRFEVYENVISKPTDLRFLADVTSELVNENISGIIHVVGKELYNRMQFAEKIAEAAMLNKSLLVGVHQKVTEYNLNSILETERLQSLNLGIAERASFPKIVLSNNFH